MKNILRLASAFILVSCSVSGDFQPQVVEVVKTVENVKYISSSIPDGRDEKSFNQRSYSIHQESRLLLRYLRFGTYLTDVDKDLPIRLQINLVDESMTEAARQDLQLCPISREWMMAASWSKPTFLNNDSWTEGGEFDESQCVSALDPADIPKMTGTAKSGSKFDQALAEWACSEEGDSAEICFDISDWYHKYVLQSDTNNGWMLVNNGESNIEVYGDSHNALGPRLQWFSTKYVWVPDEEEEPEEVVESESNNQE